MASKNKEAAMLAKRRELMWQLHQLVAETLMERLKDPDATAKGSTFSVAVQFLKDNNITVSAKDSTAKALEDQLKMLADVPFQ